MKRAAPRRAPAPMRWAPGDLVAAAWALLALASLASCDRDQTQQSDRIALRLRADEVIDVSDIRFAPLDAVRAVRVDPGWVLIERARDVMLTIRVPGMCSTQVTAETSQPGRETTIQVRPLFDLRDRAQVGFDAEFAIDAQPGCEEARRGRLSWRQIEGPPLAQLVIAKGGWSVRARTLPLARFFELPLPHGLVPIAPRTQGRYVLEATWQAEGTAAVKRRVTVTSIARATGVPSIAVTQEVLLGGSGWHVKQPPHGGRAQVRDLGDYALFTPDAHGRWALADANDQPLTLQALWHDRTPLDCGRSECHGSVAAAATRSPMSHAFERRFAATGRAPDGVGCMLECHVTGERGIRDGGFLDVATELGFDWLGRPAWDELPTALQRLGGVRCMACHGPGAIPEPSARSTILRSDVCATCHDAPPRYVHVAEWRASRMARADEAPQTRSDAACARCHTTAGFLEHEGLRKRTELDRAAAPAGIACTTCHAPHAAQSGARLLRLTAVPESLDRASERASAEPTASESAKPAADAFELDPRAALCSTCHAPGHEALPAASAAALWAGRVRMTASAGSELVSGPAPHRGVPGGCVGCHGRRAKPGALDHSFRVDRATCAECHRSGVPAGDASLQARASELLSQLYPRCSGAPSAPPEAGTHPHASAARVGNCPSPALGRALYEVLLVIEDPAAAVHNPVFAKQLLDDASARLSAKE